MEFPKSSGTSTVPAGHGPDVSGGGGTSRGAERMKGEGGRESPSPSPPTKSPQNEAGLQEGGSERRSKTPPPGCARAVGDGSRSPLVVSNGYATVASALGGDVGDGGEQRGGMEGQGRVLGVGEEGRGPGSFDPAVGEAGGRGRGGGGERGGHQGGGSGEEEGEEGGRRHLHGEGNGEEMIPVGPPLVSPRGLFGGFGFDSVLIRFLSGGFRMRGSMSLDVSSPGFIPPLHFLLISLPMLVLSPSLLFLTACVPPLPFLPSFPSSTPPSLLSFLDPSFLLSLPLSFL